MACPEATAHRCGCARRCRGDRAAGRVDRGTTGRHGCERDSGRIVQPNIHQDESTSPVSPTSTRRFTRSCPVRRHRSRACCSGRKRPRCASCNSSRMRAKSSQRCWVRRTRWYWAARPSSSIREGRAADIYYNSVFALNHKAELLWRYDKAHLVPFGEYLPLRPVLEKIRVIEARAGRWRFQRRPRSAHLRCAGVRHAGPAGLLRNHLRRKVAR